MTDPVMSVITPSYNQGRFIQRTIRSVLDQDIAGIEYVVIDGGSTDDTLSILQSCDSRLRWVSEPDRGQADAINKGLRSSRGDIISWLNSDDVYYSGALAAVRSYFDRHPEADVVYGDAHHIDENDRIIESYCCEPWDRDRLREVCFLCQPAVFLRRRVVERCGPLDARLQFCMDYEYWLRLSQLGVRFGYLRRYLAGSRMHPNNKTIGQRVKVHAEINRMLRRRLGSVPDRWLSNYAHVRLERAGLTRDTAPRRFTITVAAVTLLASLRWNRLVSRSLLTQCWSWFRAGLGPPSHGAPRPARGTDRATVLRPRATARRIGFDVSQTGDRKAGCGWVADTLVQHLTELDHSSQFILYRSFGGDFWDPEGPEATRRVVRENVSDGPIHHDQRTAREFWRCPPTDLEARLGYPDVVHSNNFFCPPGLSTARLVYTLYDLHFLDHPEWTTEQNRLICFDGVFRASLHADVVMAISEASRDHFLRVFPHYPEERTAVVHLASRFRNTARLETPPSLAHLEPRAFILNVGTLEPRKNHGRLLRAYAAHAHRVRDPRPLVLAGGDGWLSENLENMLSELEISDRVIQLGYVSETELQWLYQNCRAFAYPSLAEGFGLPVVEAASQGAAIIASRMPSTEEVVGEAALLVDPTSESEIENALDLVERDADLRRHLRQAAADYASRFSWTTSAERVLTLYQMALAMDKYTGATTQ